MRTNFLFSLHVPAFLLVVILTLLLSPGQITAATNSNLDGLALTLSTTKQSYILGEPIALGCTVKKQL